MIWIKQGSERKKGGVNLTWYPTFRAEFCPEYRLEGPNSIQPLVTPLTAVHCRDHCSVLPARFRVVHLRQWATRRLRSPPKRVCWKSTTLPRAPSQWGIAALWSLGVVPAIACWIIDLCTKFLLGPKVSEWLLCCSANEHQQRSRWWAGKG